MSSSLGWDLYIGYQYLYMPKLSIACPLAMVTCGARNFRCDVIHILYLRHPTSPLRKQLSTPLSISSLRLNLWYTPVYTRVRYEGLGGSTSQEWQPRLAGPRLAGQVHVTLVTASSSGTHTRAMGWQAARPCALARPTTGCGYRRGASEIPTVSPWRVYR